MEALTRTKTKADKLIIFTDMQLFDANNSWSRSYNKGNFDNYYAEYRKVSPDVKTLFWNLAGYSGGTPLKLNKDILEVSGFSESMLGVIAKMWQDPNALVNEIEAITL